MKTRLVMKRLRDVKPGDQMVGRMDWTVLRSVRRIVSVRPSRSRPGKLVLVYELPERPWQDGWVRRSPDFYVICVKQV